MKTATDLWGAIASGDLRQVQDLLADDATLAGARNAKGLSAVMTAMYHRRPEIAGALAAAGAPLDLMELIALGLIDAVAGALEDEGALASRSPDGFHPLHYAAFFGRAEILKLLLDRGADPNAVADNASRVQPLHSAVAVRCMECINLLLAAGVSVNARQEGGWTALQAAAKHGDLELIDLLLQHGADPGQLADSGQSAVDIAVAEGHEAAARRLRG